MTVRRHELTEQQWARLKPLLDELAPQQPKTGKPNRDHRLIVNGVVWKLVTGAPWRDLPERHGPWSTVYRLCWRRQRAGIWDRLFAAVQRQEDVAGRLDWSLQFLVSTMDRQPQTSSACSFRSQVWPVPRCVLTCSHLMR